MGLTAAVAAVTAIAWLVVRHTARSIADRPSMVRGQDAPCYELDPHVVSLLTERAERARRHQRQAT